jgi:hypothetical protein
VIAGKIDLNFASAAVLDCIMHRFLCNPIKLRCHKRAKRKRGGVAVGFHDAVNTAIPSHTLDEFLQRRFQISDSVGSLQLFLLFVLLQKFRSEVWKKLPYRRF